MVVISSGKFSSGLFHEYDIELSPLELAVKKKIPKR